MSINSSFYHIEPYSFAVIKWRGNRKRVKYTRKKGSKVIIEHNRRTMNYQMLSLYCLHNKKRGCVHLSEGVHFEKQMMLGIFSNIFKQWC